jgi:hypothetical protein
MLKFPINSAKRENENHMSKDSYSKFRNHH